MRKGGWPWDGREAEAVFPACRFAASGSPPDSQACEVSAPGEHNGHIGGSASCRMGSMVIGADLGLLVTLVSFSLQPVCAPNLQLDEVLFLYGVESQVEQIPEQIRSQLDSYEDARNAGVFEILQDVLPRAYAKENLMASVRSVFYREAEGRDLSPALEWLQSPLAVRIAQLEAEASRPEAWEEMRKFAGESQDLDPESPRLQLFLELDEAAGVTESGIRVLLEMARSTARGLNHLEPEGQQKSEETLASEIRQIESQVRPAFQESTPLLLRFKFRTLGDEEIRQYLEFVRSSEGQWLQEAVIVSLIQALREAGDRTGHLIDERIKESGF